MYQECIGVLRMKMWQDISMANEKHVEFQCNQVGLVIHPLYPYLGASPDGFVSCLCCGEGIIEIKCPYSVKDGIPEDLKLKKGSFLNAAGLARTRKYYAQVECQLELCQRSYCDFFVWTPNGYFIQLIYKDLSFIEKLIKKLTSFFIEYILPELLTHSLKNSLPSTSTSTSSSSIVMASATSTSTSSSSIVMASASTPDIYCICQSEEHGTMIECENSACKYSWFHFECVGLKRTPSGTWYVMSVKRLIRYQVNNYIIIVIVYCFCSV